jgi:toxin FitB
VYLIDTNVISEARKGSRSNAGVQRFWQEANEADIFLPVQVIGEIRRGLENIRGRGDLAQAARLEHWLDQLVGLYADRILGFDLDCAQLWGKLMSPGAQHPIDKQIAAIALLHDMTVVTRNISDFTHTGVQLFNPFTET